MCKLRQIGLLIFFLLSIPVYTYAQTVGDFSAIAIKDDIKWIDATSINPGDYIGQIFLVKKDNSTIPFYAPIPIPFVAQDEPTVKKSVLIKTSSDGSVSFLGFFKMNGQKEHVYQFQIVDGKKWIADMKSKDYLKAIASFRNDPVTSAIFDSDEYSGVVMVVGVVGEKIWYKSFQKESYGASGTYLVKVDGNTYYGAEDYEEVTKYGLLLRPISGYGYKLPKAIVSSTQVTEIGEKVKFDVKTKDNLGKTLETFVIGKSKVGQAILH